MKRRVQVLLALALWGSTTISCRAAAIVEAVSRNDEPAVSNLLKNGADPNERRSGTTGLHLAAEWGFTHVTELLLKSGAKSDAVDNYQRTPLIWATLNGRSEVARLLIAAGGDLSWRDDEGNSALSNAAASKDKALVKLLFDSGAKILPDDDKTLRNSIEVGDAEMLRRFIEAGADPCFHPGKDSTKFSVAGAAESLEVVKILAGAATNCSETRTSLSEIFRAAADNGRLDFVEYLLPRFASARDKNPEEAKSSENATAQAFSAAVKADKLEVAKFLLEKASDLSPQQRGTPLAGTLHRKQSAMFHLLLDHGAALDEQDDTGTSPLLQCAWDGDLENAKFLISRGAKVKANATDRTTPLIAASRIGSVPLIELFLEHGSTCREIDEGKRGPLLAAVIEGNADACRILLQHGCDPNVADPDDGFTALHYAASRCDVATAEILLAARANATLKDKSSRTARELADESGATEIVELLSHIPDRKERRSHR
jgi:ankyrin repeat protein